MEAVNWVCDDVLDDNMWVPELYHLVPTSENSGSSAMRSCKPMHGPVVYAVGFRHQQITIGNLHEGEILEKDHGAIDFAYRSTFVLLFWRMNTT